MQAHSPQDAARQIREAFPEATELHQAAAVVGSTSIDKIRSDGFDVMPNKTPLSLSAQALDKVNAWVLQEGTAAKSVKKRVARAR